MQIVDKNINDLIFAEYNPRQLMKDEYKQLKDSITRFGLVDPIIVNKNEERKNIIVGGHQRVRIAKDMKIKEVPCVEVDLTLDKERELNIRLNKNSGSWDYDALANMFDTDELTDWGFTEGELVGFDLEDKAGLIDDDDIPEAVESVCKLGNLWELGQHRLLCGDSTKKENIELLLDATNPDFFVYDPPFVSTRGTFQSEIRGIEEFKNNLSVFDGVLENHFQNGVIVTFLSTRELLELYSLSNSPISFRHEYLWIIEDTSATIMQSKVTPITKHCIIAVFRKIGEKAEYSSKDSTSSIIETNRGEGGKKIHKHQKPISITVDMLKRYRGNIALDTFLGSGSTLIACEKTNRVCYGMELDEHYCDVIINRWEQFTGKKAKLLNG